MKAELFNIEGKKIKSIDLPSQFDTPYRPELIKRAVLVVQKNRRQPYGADPMAGKRASAELSRRRRKYRGSYGKGISRVPRKILSRRGSQMYMVGAFAPGTVGGRRAHPPKAEKDWTLKMNTKERRLAISSAIAATANKTLVTKRGHITEITPIILDTRAEEMSKTKDVIALMNKLNLGKELERAAIKKVRAGKGKNRGRKYKKRKGPLFVVSNKCNLSRAAKNIPGVDIKNVNLLNAELLAPGTVAGRLTIYTAAALEKLDKEKLFLNVQTEKETKKVVKKAVKKESKE